LGHGVVSCATMATCLQSAAAAGLHQIADVSRLDTGADERHDVVVAQLLQLNANTSTPLQQTLDPSAPSDCSRLRFGR